jgi:hypothetical protein
MTFPRKQNRACDQRKSQILIKYMAVVKARSELQQTSREKRQRLRVPDCSR